MAFRDLREFMEQLELEGELVRIEREVDPVYEVAAGIRKTSDIDGPALLFERVKGSELPVLGGLFAKRRRALMALGTTEERVLEDFLTGLHRPLPPRRIEGPAPCQEVVWQGEEVDLYRLPICTHSAKDGGPFITVAVSVARDPEYGVNLSINRCQLKGKRKLSLLAPDEFVHLGIYYGRAEARGEPLEIALVLGPPPEVSIASQIRGPIDLDELACAGGLRGEPVKTVRCVSIDLEVPAHSEIVIEGRMPPQVREFEGPFGEFPGYYGPGTMSPIVEVSAVTLRRDAIYQAGLTGKPVTDNHVLRVLPWECALYEHMCRLHPGAIRGVYITPGGACTAHAVISLRQRYRDQAKAVILSALSAGVGLKHVVVVDEEIDIKDPHQVEWAIAYRCQATEDVLIVPRVQGGLLDPSAAAAGLTAGMSAGMGIDATRPFGLPFAEVVEVPGAEAFEIPLPAARRRERQGS